MFSEERGTTAVSREADLLLIYGWNSCPVPMTDIARSMIVCGRQWIFPIDFSQASTVRLTGDEKWADTYAANHAKLLLHSREIASLLIDQTRAYHREKMNQLRPDPL